MVSLRAPTCGKSAASNTFVAALGSSCRSSIGAGTGSGFAATAGADVQILEVYDLEEELINHYPIAITAGTDQPGLAEAWIEFVLGSGARQVLDEAGFGTP